MFILFKLFLATFTLLNAHATTVNFFQATTYSMPSPSNNSGGLSFTGGGMILGLGHGKLTTQTGAAYVTEALHGTNAGYLMVPLWLKLRLAHSLFVRFGGNLKYQVDRLTPGINALNLGVLVGGGLDIPLGRTTGLVVAMDYNHSLSNVSQSGTLNKHALIGWVGLRFGRM